MRPGRLRVTGRTARGVLPGRTATLKCVWVFALLCQSVLKACHSAAADGFPRFGFLWFGEIFLVGLKALRCKGFSEFGQTIRCDSLPYNI